MMHLIAGQAAAQTEGGLVAFPTFLVFLLAPWSKRAQHQDGGGEGEGLD